jgi:hypothetical protein
MSTIPVFLDDCEKLNAGPYTECTRFSRFVLLRPRPKRGGSSVEGTLPVAALPTDYRFRDPKRLDLLSGRAAGRLRELQVKFPVVAPDPTAPRRSRRATVARHTVAGLGDISVGRALDRERRIEAMRHVFPTAVQPGAFVHHGPGPQGTLGLRVSLDRVLQPLIKSVRDYIQLGVDARSQAVWAIGLNFEQCWTSLGYRRGRLVRSLPLTPGEQIEIVVKTWDRRTSRRSEVESVARQLSTEITGEEKWMLATKMLFGDQAQASVNPSAGVNAGLTIPIDVVTATLGGTLGLSGNFANQLSQSTEHGTEFIHSSMIRAAQSLQSTRTNSVELSHETGEETSRRQVIANTNRCHTLTYHYFEVVEQFEVHTQFDGASLYLLIGLPLPEITPEWVLCHECYLRKVLPCETYYAGLAGARTILSWAKLQHLYPPRPFAPAPAGPGGKGGAADGFVSPFGDAVRDVLERWAILKNAELLAFGGTPAAGDDFLAKVAEGGQAIADGLGKLAADAADGVDAALTAAGDAIDDGLALIGEATQAVGGAVGGVLGSIFGQPQALAFGGQPHSLAFGGPPPQGGPGTWLYREVAAIAAPQIIEALSFLETSWPRTQSLPPQERALAEFTVLQAFLAKLGMPSFTFGKVDALFAGAAAAAVGAGGLAGGTVGAVGGGVAGAAVAVWGFGVSAIPGAAVGATLGGMGGAALGAGAVASTLGLLALLEAMGIADTVPDDVGLKEAMLRLRALVDSTSAMAPVTGLPGTGNGAGSDDAVAIEHQREQALRLVEAQVEYERLACHLRQHLISYMQGLWAALPDHEILAEVRRQGIPEEAVSPRFAGFHGRFGALPVVDVDWVESEGGLDWEKTAADLARRAERQGHTDTITLATPGMVVEPSLGRCDACEPFIEAHRALDLEHRRAEVDVQKARARQEALEADRFQERIDKEQLGDPTPFEGAAVKVTVQPPQEP